MNYNADYFINKFEPIPESKWCIYAMINDKGQKCARGHCNAGIRMDIKIYPSIEDNALCELFEKLGHQVWDVNNGYHGPYQQLTPKQRILAALRDIKALDEKNNPIKDRIVYVTVDEKVRELQKSILSEQ